VVKVQPDLSLPNFEVGVTTVKPQENHDCQCIYPPLGLLYIRHDAVAYIFE
jgi:hypothetical protein